MKHNSIFLFTCIFLVGILSCNPPVAEETAAIDLTQAKAEIQAMEDAFAAGLKNKDAEAVVAYYSDDAVNMSANEPTAVGKPAILARMQANMAKDSTESTEVFEVLELIPAGDYLIEVGKSTSTEADGKVSTGKYISIFEKRDGKYVCIRDIWNNDAPKESN